jgi:hypothetical protein
MGMIYPERSWYKCNNKTPYCIVLKTNSSGSNTTKKTYSVTSSQVVTIKNK